MADEPIRFRCYRCGKLLGASPRRVGAVANCPRCHAELQVPEPDDIDPASLDRISMETDVASAELDFLSATFPDAPPSEIVAPPIRLDVLSPASTPPSAPDVVLPPGVVMAWSLLVLMAIPMAFLAGLLIGRFVWR